MVVVLLFEKAFNTKVIIFQTLSFCNVMQKAAGMKDAKRISDPVFLQKQKAAGTKDALPWNLEN